MKRIYEHRILDWILIVINLFVLARAVYILTLPINYANSYSLRVVFFIASLLPIVSLFTSKMDSERFYLIFIATTLISTPVYFGFSFLKSLALYLSYRKDLIYQPGLWLNLIIGGALLYFTIKYSRKTRSERFKDYFLFVILLGFYLVILTLFSFWDNKLFGNMYFPFLLKYPFQLIFNALVVFFGFRLFQGKILFKKGIIYVIILIILRNLF